MNGKYFGLFLIVSLFCCTVTSCGKDDEPTPSTSTTQTEPGPAEEPDSTDDPNTPTDTNEHDYVDLGLSVKWATCNVGASSPEEYGNYYAWGEIETKEEYTSDNCATWRIKMGDIAGDPNYDAATANWGSPWRMPTWEEIEELTSTKNCTAEWTTLNGVRCMLVTSKINGNSIFLPAAGFRYWSSLFYVVENGYWWSSTPSDDNTDAYFFMLYESQDEIGWNWAYRSNGLSVRAVCD